MGVNEMSAASFSQMNSLDDRSQITRLCPWKFEGGWWGGGGNRSGPLIWSLQRCLGLLHCSTVTFNAACVFTQSRQLQEQVLDNKGSNSVDAPFPSNHGPPAPQTGAIMDSFCGQQERAYCLRVFNLHAPGGQSKLACKLAA